MVNTAEELLFWLQGYVDRNANGEWEHIHSLSIELIDNPGWMMQCDIDLETYAPVQYPGIKSERSDKDWIHCSYGKSKFIGACGVSNLVEMISEFKNFENEYLKRK